MCVCVKIIFDIEINWFRPIECDHTVYYTVYHTVYSISPILEITIKWRVT